MSDVTMGGAAVAGVPADAGAAYAAYRGVVEAQVREMRRKLRMDPDEARSEGDYAFVRYHQRWLRERPGWEGRNPGAAPADFRTMLARRVRFALMDRARLLARQAARRGAWGLPDGGYTREDWADLMGSTARYDPLRVVNPHADRLCGPWVARRHHKFRVSELTQEVSPRAALAVRRAVEEDLARTDFARGRSGPKAEIRKAVRAALKVLGFTALQIAETFREVREALS